MLLSSLQPPLLERSLQLSKFHCHKDYDHPASCNRLHIAATKSAVAPRYTPGRGKIVPRNVNK